MIFIHLYIPWYGFLIIFVCIGFGYAYYIGSKGGGGYDFVTPMLMLCVIVGTIIGAIAFLIGKFLC